MKTSIRVFQQQIWREPRDVAIHPHAIVTVNGQDVATKNEIALANIILRLNAYNQTLKKILDIIPTTVLWYTNNEYNTTNSE